MLFESCFFLEDSELSRKARETIWIGFEHVSFEFEFESLDENDSGLESLHGLLQGLNCRYYYRDRLHWDHHKDSSDWIYSMA